MRKYIDYLTPELKQYTEFKELGNTIDKQFDKLQISKDSVLNNSFIMRLDDYGCSRWEKMLHIARRDTDSIEDRRFRILTKFLNQLPYTERRLREMLDSVCGAGGYKMTVDIVNECVRVRVDVGRKNQFTEVERLLEDIVPLNMWLDIKLLYNTHRMLGVYTHRKLGTRTHKQLREERLDGNIY